MAVSSLPGQGDVGHPLDVHQSDFTMLVGLRMGQQSNQTNFLVFAPSPLGSAQSHQAFGCGKSGWAD